MEQKEIIPHLFKTEYRKIIAVLCKSFGINHLEIAEDIVNDTFLLATETWGQKGVPEHPKAWLYAVAKNKTKDHLKRHQLFAEKISIEVNHFSQKFHEIELDLSDQNIKDSQLLMIFAICDPIIPSESQVGLALRILCGFGIEEIAEAFVSNKETINKRLFRAKEKLRKANTKFDMIDSVELTKRIEPVLTTIYLLFNEGYYSSTQNVPLRKDLCFEAMRLTYLLLENKKTNLPKVNALMALMCFHASRFEARMDHNGNLILYDNQNKMAWDSELIAKGEFYLNHSAKGNVLTKYHLESAIAFWHSRKDETTEKWEKILQLYNQILQIDYSAIAALNRTYALSKANGKQAAIKEALKINLKENHLYHILLARLYKDLNPDKRIYHLQTALSLAKTKNDKEFILKNPRSFIILTTVYQVVMFLILKKNQFP